MKRKIIAGLAVVLAGLVLSGPLSAHHAARMFEPTPIRVKGTVVRYIWANPHSSIIVEQKTEDGRTIRWALESSAPVWGLEFRGFNKDSFKVGEVIEACGFAPKSTPRALTQTSNQDNASSGPVWLEGADRVITARLLLTQDGPSVDWSHYGPLELCISEEELEALARG